MFVQIYRFWDVVSFGLSLGVGGLTVAIVPLPDLDESQNKAGYTHGVFINTPYCLYL